jgi:hypothetical protein
MKNPFGTYQPGGGHFPEDDESPEVSEAKPGDLLLKERDELEKKLAEKTAELARAKNALRGEITKRQDAEQSLREARENFGILMDYEGRISRSPGSENQRENFDYSFCPRPERPSGAD